MYDQCLTQNSANTNSYIATMFDTRLAKRKNKFECRKDYYKHLTRPDGMLLSEKDCLLLDLCIQWTKDGKIKTSTYEWLLENKFPRQKHHITVKRTFDNISNYIKGEFKNKQIVDGIVHKDKIRIERVADFNLKIHTAIEKSEGKYKKNNSIECRPSSTRMSTMVNQNVDPSTYIRKNTIKKTDNNDNLNNQFQNSNFLEKEAEQVETEVLTENIECNKMYDGLPEEKIVTKALPKPKTTEFVETIDNLKTNTAVSKKDTRPTEIGLDGKTYYTIPLKNFKYSESLLKEIISKCNRNRQHYTTGKVISIIRNILEKFPGKQIRGGRAGFKKYMIFAINGENDYTEKGAMNEEEKLTSIAEKNAIEALEMQKLFESGEVQYF